MDNTEENLFSNLIRYWYLYINRNFKKVYQVENHLKLAIFTSKDKSQTL